MLDDRVWEVDDAAGARKTVREVLVLGERVSGELFVEADPARGLLLDAHEAPGHELDVSLALCVDDVARVAERREEALGDAGEEDAPDHGLVPADPVRGGLDDAPGRPDDRVLRVGPRERREELRVDRDVVVEEDEDVALGRVDPLVSLVSDARSARDHLECRHPARWLELGQDRRGRTAGLAVDDDHLVGEWVRGQDALERLAQQLGASKRRDQDREQHFPSIIASLRGLG